jgi:hypothetical protein
MRGTIAFRCVRPSTRTLNYLDAIRRNSEQFGPRKSEFVYRFERLIVLKSDQEIEAMGQRFNQKGGAN